MSDIPIWTALVHEYGSPYSWSVCDECGQESVNDSAKCLQHIEAPARPEQEAA